MEGKKFFCNYAMLIDDSGIDNFIHEKQLKTSRFARTIEVFVNAEEALRVLAREKQLPDYIFLDIHMPFKDGFEFLDELGVQPDKFKAIKIVILTASAHPIDRLRAESYPQITAYFDKPLDQKHLLELKMNTVKQKI